MKTDKELLEDTSFDREICPRDKKSDILVLLLTHKAYDKDSAIGISKYDIIEEKELKKEGLVKIKGLGKIRSLYLTTKGKIVACGEYALRQREQKEKCKK